MNAEHFIALAGTLVATATGDPESRYRTAVSRAYYGAFHLAVDVLEQLGKKIPANHQGHQAAFRELQLSQVPAAMAAGRLISDLHGSRIKADYRMNDPRFAKIKNAQLAVEDAHSACSSLKKCLEEPVRTQLMEYFATRDS